MSLAAGGVAAMAPGHAFADEVSIVASADSAIGKSGTDGDLSNGAGSFLVVGRTNENDVGLRRSLFLFDVAGNVPAGSTILAAELRAEIIKSNAGTIALHALIESWTEGPSTADDGKLAASMVGDVDWSSRTHDTVPWTVEGGAFDAAVLSSGSFAADGPIVLPSSPALVAAVQSWLDAPGQNHGLIAVGNEAMTQTALALASREDPDPDFHPRLVVDYEPPLAVGDLVITEIMQSPNAVEPASGQWFEIHNTHALTAIDVTGWTVSDAGGESFVIGPLDPLPPGGYLVLGNNGDSGANGGVTVDFVYPSSFVLEDADEIIITDTEGEEWDRVAWDAGATFPQPMGATMTLDDNRFHATDNDEGANWCVARTAFGDGDLGTPGAANDPCDDDGDGFHYDVDCVDTGSIDGVDAVNIHPGAAETAGNLADEDCNGSIDCFEDADADGFGSSVILPDADVLGGVCDAAAMGRADDALDCDDTSMAISPAAAEIACDSIDNDCNIATVDHDGTCGTGGGSVGGGGGEGGAGGGPGAGGGEPSAGGMGGGIAPSSAQSGGGGATPAESEGCDCTVPGKGRLPGQLPMVIAVALAFSAGARRRGRRFG